MIRRSIGLHRHVLTAIILTTSTTALAQVTAQSGPDDDPVYELPQRTEPGQVAKSLVGQAGQRQDKTLLGETFRPLARIDSRLDTRLDTRIRSRVDQDYDPTVDLNARIAQKASTDRQRRPR